VSTFSLLCGGATILVRNKKRVENARNGKQKIQSTAEKLAATARLQLLQLQPHLPVQLVNVRMFSLPFGGPKILVRNKKPVENARKEWKKIQCTAEKHAACALECQFVRIMK